MSKLPFRLSPRLFTQKIITALLLFTCLSGYGQVLSGKYLFRNDLGGDHTTVFHFKEDSTFSEVNFFNYNLSSEKKGDFLVKHDTLTLYYKEPAEKMVVIREKKPVTTNSATEKMFSNVNINLYNRTSDAPATSMIHFKDVDNKFVMATAIQNTFALTLYNDELKSAIITALGDHDVEIDLEPLIGFNTTIDVQYSKIKHPVVLPHRQRFYLEKLENGNLKLHPLDEDRSPWVIQKTK